jgi:mannosyl-3-phosphoglycerate phosphatase
LKPLIATDLDGTLLDDRYDLAGAAAAVDAVTDRALAVVLASSKTFPEMRTLAERCRVRPALVFENGAGLAVPDDSAPGGWRVQRRGPGYGRLRAILGTLRADGYVFRGFGDMDAQEVSERTGLALEDARTAREREATEPLVWEDSEARLERFRERLAERDLALVRGGRFVHVMPPVDKAGGVRDAREALGAGSAPLIGCGDAPNDLALLEASDVAVVFPDRHGVPLEPAGAGRVVRAHAAGADGWLAAVGRALDALGNR